MRTIRRLSLFASLLVALSLSGLSAQSRLVTVASFMPPELPEGIAIDPTGAIYLTMAPTGEVRRLDRDGRQSTVTSVRVGEGFLVGLTTDATGTLYAALASGDAAGADTQGVWRIRPSGATELVAALPGGFPNDVKFDARGNLFVSDSVLGAIWRVAPGGQPSRWLEHPLLQGHGDVVGPGCPGVNAPFSSGANGLAFAADGSLYVANTEFGRIVRVPVLPDGRAGTPQTVVEDCGLLGGADGIAFDRAGSLYVAVNTGNRIVRVSPTGALAVLATAADGLDNPASVAFSTAAGDEDSLYITNFAIFSAMGGGTPRPALLRLEVDVPLPKPGPKKG